MPRLVVLLVLVLAACSALPRTRPAAGRAAEDRRRDRDCALPSRRARPSRRLRREQLPRVSSHRCEPIGPALRDRMRFSHRPGCPLRLGGAAPSADQLRRLRREGARRGDGGPPGPRTGRHRGLRAAVRGPLADSPGCGSSTTIEGDDDRSMAANNTSGYNCRRVAGSASWSEHAYGAAIDINPVQNPYVTSDLDRAARGRPFAAIDRSAERDGPPRRDPGGRRRRPGVRGHRLGVGGRLVRLQGLPALLGLGQPARYRRAGM